MSKNTVDFMGTTSWDGNGVDGLCSVDLDGWHPGSIRSSAFSTKRGASYTLTFLFSGNGGYSPSPIKTMKISIDRQFTTYTWNTSSGNDIENGIYANESWTFKATGKFAVLTLLSQDPKDSPSGPVVAGMSIVRK